MSEFAKVFADIMTGGDENKNARIAQSREIFGHTEVDAFIIDEAIQRGIIAMARELGAAIDGLSARLAPDAMPMMLHRASVNIVALEEQIVLAVLGQVRPTRGCDCKACENAKALNEQLRITEQAANAAGEKE